MATVTIISFLLDSFYDSGTLIFQKIIAHVLSINVWSIYVNFQPLLIDWCYTLEDIEIIWEISILVILIFCGFLPHPYLIFIYFRAWLEFIFSWYKVITYHNLPNNNLHKIITVDSSILNINKKNVWRLKIGNNIYILELFILLSLTCNFHIATLIFFIKGDSWYQLKILNN